MSSKVKTIIWTVVVIILIRAVLVYPYVIPSGSMEDTLLPGDVLLALKFVYGMDIPYTDIRIAQWRKPKRGDIIIFKYPVDERKHFVKRCIGEPGDTIEIRNKVVYINGRKLNEPYAVHKDSHVYPSRYDLTNNPWAQKLYQKSWENREFMNDPTVRDNFGPIVVPKGTVFAMGDNRDYSYDSRFWGPVPYKLVIGIPFIIYFSYNPSAPWSKPWEKIRWSRIFAVYDMGFGKIR